MTAEKNDSAESPGGPAVSANATVPPAPLADCVCPPAGGATRNMEQPEPWTIPEFAALCRERCGVPAQGFDDGRPCGSAHEDGDGHTVFTFCGRHWGTVL